MNTITIVVILSFSLAWWLAFTISFFIVDRPEARSSGIVASNLVQAIFHIFLPLVPIAKSFDKTLPRLELKAYQFFSLSLIALAVTAFLIELITR
jgi:hypothetical protein